MKVGRHVSFADMNVDRHVSFSLRPTGDHDAILERPDEDDPAQTNTNDKLANEHAGLEHKQTANLKQARRAGLCSPR